MANDFSGDSRCKALWRFESGALTADSKGTNTLTSHGSPAEESTIIKEGSGACYLPAGSWFTRADADLSAGFPLKTGDTTKQITVCGWFRANDLGLYHVPWMKGSGTDDCGIWWSPSWVAFFVKWNNNGNMWNIQPTAGKYYHLAMAIDGIAGTCRLRLYDEQDGVVHSTTLTGLGTLNLNTGPFNVNVDTGPCYADECLVFAGLLSDAEIDSIRSGTFVMSTQLDVFQVVAQVEFTNPAFFSVGQAVAQVEWVELPAGTFVYTGNIGITVTPASENHLEFLPETEIPVTIAPESTYYLQLPDEYVYIPTGIGVSITPASDTYRDRFYDGSIPVGVTPASDYNCPVRLYDGEIPVEITPASDTQFVPKQDVYTASGTIKMCGASAVVLTSRLISEYAADGCLSLVGEGVLDTPTAIVYEASGALKLCGQGTFNSPPLSAFCAAGQVELCGSSMMGSTAPPAIVMVTEYVAGGFLALLGACPLVTASRPTDAYVAAGGYFLRGGSGLALVMPSSLPVGAYAAAGCYELSGPCRNPRGSVTAYAADTTTGPVLRLYSRALIGFLFPQVTEMAAEGGYVLESPGVPDEGIFETLALTGARGEVSVYSNFKFNSYAKYGGRYYGATQDGIFLLEGDDDAGAEIHSGAKIGPTNFGTDREKRLRLVRCGGDCAQAKVRVSNGNGGGATFPVENGRAGVSREVQGRELTVEIADFKTLNHLEIIPLILAKR